MFGWDSRASACTSQEAIGKTRVGHAFGRQNFQRDNPIQLRLARLVNHAHAAAPEAFQNFKLRKMRGQFGRRGRRRHRGGFIRKNGLRSEIQRHHATRAEAAGHVLLERRAALRADFRRQCAHAL